MKVYHSKTDGSVEDKEENTTYTTPYTVQTPASDIIVRRSDEQEVNKDSIHTQIIDFLAYKNRGVER